MTTLASIVYLIVAILIAVYAVHRLILSIMYFKSRRLSSKTPDAPKVWPTVTVQLPLFNERNVVRRLIQAVGRLDYPKELLEIQILDDSTDETSEIVHHETNLLQKKGLRVQHVRRRDRHGFKAGALAHGLSLLSSEYVAVFDADFVPTPSFLRELIPWFDSPDIGMVQSRWSHINESESFITKAQAAMLDAHFYVEHLVRSRNNLCMNFNGTAGIWRTEAIRSSGGWHFDTLTEDLDLSYRAQLAGWAFRYVPTTEAPAELPVSTGALRIQQRRWSKGAAQTARKLLPFILRSKLTLRQKIEACFHLTNHMAYIFIVLLVASAPLATYQASSGFTQLATTLMLLSSICFCVFFLIPQFAQRRPLFSSLMRIPHLISLGIGLSINNTLAYLSGFRTNVGSFERTPKTGFKHVSRLDGNSYLPTFCKVALLETCVGLYVLVSIFILSSEHYYLSLSILSFFALGFGYMAAQHFAEISKTETSKPDRM